MIWKILPFDSCKFISRPQKKKQNKNKLPFPLGLDLGPCCLFHYAHCQLWKSVWLSTLSQPGKTQCSKHHWTVHLSSINRRFSLLMWKWKVRGLRHKWEETGGRKDDKSFDCSWRAVPHLNHIFLFAPIGAYSFVWGIVTENTEICKVFSVGLLSFSFPP